MGPQGPPVTLSSALFSPSPALSRRRYCVFLSSSISLHRFALCSILITLCRLTLSSLPSVLPIFLLVPTICHPLFLLSPPPPSNPTHFHSLNPIQGAFYWRHKMNFTVLLTLLRERFFFILLPNSIYFFFFFKCCSAILQRLTNKPARESWSESSALHHFTWVLKSRPRVLYYAAYEQAG